MTDDPRGSPIDDETDCESEPAELVELADQITRRLQSGEAVNDDDCACAGPMRQLLPALRTMVSLGDLVAREERSRRRLRADTDVRVEFS